MPYLSFNDGKGNRVIELGKESLTVGRSKVNDICLSGHGKISRRHCRVYFCEKRDSYALSDYGATNGTILNGGRINGDVILSDGDEIRVGDIKIKFNDKTDNLKTTRRVVGSLLTSQDPTPTELTKTVEKFAYEQPEVPLSPDGINNLRQGSKIGRYEILRKLGNGEHSVVYLVGAEGIDSAIALKIYKKDFSRNYGAREAFTENFNKILDFHHISFTHYIESGVHNGHCFFSMQYMPHVSLKTRIMKSAPMSELDALDIISVIGTGLSYAYNEFDLVHRNLKPANILFNSEDEIEISDYGMAKWSAKYLTDGVSAASPWYISPEQISGRHIDWYSDLYSLGIIFFQMLTGVFPFHAMNEDEIISMQMKMPFPLPEERNPNIRISKDSIRILKMMTKKKPEERFESWSEFLQTVQDTYERLETVLTESGPLEPEKNSGKAPQLGSKLKMKKQKLVE
jgi:serine/threonine-protein kinase